MIPGESASGARDAAALEREIESILAGALPLVDLLEVVVLRRTLRVVVDHPDGVDHGLCAQVTRALEAGGLLERFSVEVWSPGPEPPLRVERHFRRAVGRRVRLEYADPGAARGRRSRTGRLIAADGRALTIDGGEGDGAGPVRIDLSAVRRARIAEPTSPPERRSTA